MDYREWRWVAGSLDDSGMPLLTPPKLPSSADDLERCLARFAFSHHRASLSTWLHRGLARFRTSRRVVVAQEPLSDTKLSLDQRDASQQTKAA